MRSHHLLIGGRFAKTTTGCERRSLNFNRTEFPTASVRAESLSEDTPHPCQPPTRLTPADRHLLRGSARKSSDRQRKDHQHTLVHPSQTLRVDTAPHPCFWWSSWELGRVQTCICDTSHFTLSEHTACVRVRASPSLWVRRT